MSYRIFFSTIPILGILLGCQSKKTDWIDRDLNEWPELVMTNEVQIEGQTYTNLASSFLVEVEKDTLAIAAKNLFFYFSPHKILTVDFQGKLGYWDLVSRVQPDVRIHLGELLNPDTTEFTALPGGLKNTDWLIFSIKSNPSRVVPFRIRERMLEKQEIVYCLAGSPERKEKESDLIQCRVLRVLDNQIFLEMLNPEIHVAYLPGAPLFDNKGLLVGIFSTRIGTVGQACSVSYLIDKLKELSIYPK